MNQQKNGRYKGLFLKIAVSWLSIFLLAGFLFAMKSKTDLVTLSVVPEVPKTEEPVVATFSVSNPTDKPSVVTYLFYVNGGLVESGNIKVPPESTSKHQYAYRNSLARGEQVSFTLETTSVGRVSVKTLALPAYPPQLMSSFVSFAAFSTSVMSAMITMEYFSTTFGTTGGLNTGVIIVTILAALLIFLELSEVAVGGRGVNLLGRYRISLANVTGILFIIFLGMVFTRVIMILYT